MKKVLFGIAAFFVMAALMLTYIVFTDSGLLLFVRSLEKISMGNLQVADVTGKLTERFSFDKFRYVSSDSVLKVDHFELFWNPGALWQGDLHVFSCIVEDVELSNTAPEDAEDDKNSALYLPHLKIPFDILLEDLQVRNIHVISDGETVTEIDRIDLQMTGGTSFLQFDTVYLQGKDYELSLSGKVGVDKDWPVDIAGRWRYLLGGVPELQGSIQVFDSLKDAGVDLKLEAPYAAHLSGRMQFHGGGIQWKAQLDADGLDTATIFHDIPGNLNIHGSTTGMWREDNLSANFSIEQIDGSIFSYPIELKGSVIYDGEQFEIAELNAQSGEAEATIKGKLGEKLDLSYTLQPLKTTMIVPWLSGVVSGTGNVSGKFTTPVIQTVLKGEGVAAEGFIVDDIRADIKVEVSNELQASMIDAAVRVKDVKVEEQHIDRGSIDVVGSLEKHRLHLELFEEELSVVLSAHGKWAENLWQSSISKLSFTTSGKELAALEHPVPLKVGVDSVELGDMCLGYESSTFCLAGQIRDKKWQAEFSLAEFNPAYFYDEMPGALDVKARGEGQFSDGTFRSSLNIYDLGGSIKDVPVSGAGKITQRGKRIGFNNVKLKYGNSELTAEGYLDDRYDFNFVVKIPDLSSFASELGGTVNGSGMLYGSKQQPVIDLDFRAKNLTFADLKISNLHGDVGLDLHNNGRAEAIVRGSDITINGIELSSVSLLAEGTTANHLFMINSETDFGTADLQGRGSYDTAWQGVLESARLALNKYGTWNLRKDTSIEIGKGKSSLESLCLHADDARLCLQGVLLEGQNWSAHAGIDSIPLEMLKYTGLWDISLQGNLKGAVDASGNLAKLTSFKADLTAPQLILQDRWQDTIQYTFSENGVTAVLEDNSIKVNLGSSFQESGKLRGLLLLDNIQENLVDIGTIPLTGTLDFNLGDISFVSILTDGRFQPKGNLLGDLDISGNLGKPAVKGNVELEDGEVYIANLGILLQDISMKLSSALDSLNYTVKARSGPGSASSNGKVNLLGDKGFVVSGAVTGKDFEIMKTDEYQFRVSPDLELEYGGKRDSLIGSLAVPYGRITLLRSGSDTVTSTDDVIIVDAAEPTKRRDSSFFADIAVGLGEDVQIDAYGLKSDLVGAVRLIDEPGKNLSAQGELIVLNGQFSLYSAELNITRGRLLFSGGNVENPGVDVRAQRKIDNKLVGVDVSGTAEDLDFQLFSEPAMEESNVLAYILFGRPMYDSSGAETSFVNSAANALGIRGVNTITNKLGRYVPVDEIYLEGDANQEDLSIVLGKHLTKDLFIGYGHNLFDELGEFKVQYQLGNNFSIETKSSVESTSGDIIYTIER